jgi:hypothetical protein
MAAQGPSAPESWVTDLEFERRGLLRRALKKAIVQPFGNYFPAPIIRAALRLLRSELAAANWQDPGGWESMVIAYAERRRRLADRILCALVTIPMALRNRRKLAARVIARLIDDADDEPVHILCLGAGPGQIITDALRQCRRRACATLVDVSAEAFDYGRRLAADSGTQDQVRFVQGDVRDLRGKVERPADIVKMVGICEYLTDAEVTDMARAAAREMRPGATIVFNSLSAAHGTDRFFRRVFGLRLIHRTPEHLADLMRAASFSDFVSLPEPLGVYHVIIGRKTP